MIKTRTMAFVSVVIVFSLLTIPSYAAKLTPVGSGTQFSGTASVHVRIEGIRYTSNGDPAPYFDNEGFDITEPVGDAFQLEQARVEVLDNVIDSWTYTYPVIDVSAFTTSDQTLESTWYNSGGSLDEEEAGGGDEAWVENHANTVSLATICSAFVTPQKPSWYKIGADENDANNDYLTTTSVNANAEQSPDSAQFTIDGMLLEQIGEDIQVTITNSTPRIEIFNYDENNGFDVFTDTVGSVKVNGAPVAVTPGETVTITAQVGDTLTLASYALLAATRPSGYQIPGPTPPTTQDYRLHSTSVTKGLIVQVAEAAGVSEENPIIGDAGENVVFPSVPILSDGPGIDVPVWFRTPDGNAVEIQMHGASLAAFEMPGDLSGGPIGPGPVEGSVAVWFDDNGTWVEHEWSPVPPGGAINFSPGVTKIQLRGIDRSAPDPADNCFNAGLYFDGATTGAQVTISNVSGPSLVPVINLLLGN